MVEAAKTMKRVLITGSRGMLGVDLCQELRGNYELIGLDLVNSPQSIVHSFKNVDITDKKNIETVIKRARPDAVIHAAAMTDVDGCELDPKKAHKINSDGAKNVALACKAADAVLIYISTDFVFDGKKKKPYKETDKTNPLCAYADSKLKGEEAIKKILKKYYILRTSWLYGKNGRNFVDTILAKANSGEELRVVNDQVGSPTYTVDLARAIRILIDKVRLSSIVHRLSSKASSRAHFSVPSGIYHVSNSGAVSWFEYAKEILGLAGIKARVIPISSEELNRPAKRPAMSVLDNSKFIKFTGHEMRPWQEAVKDYVERIKK